MMAIFPDDLERLHKLFEVVKLYTLAAGGDGDGWVISEHYKAYADYFGAYEKQADNWFMERHDREGAVDFSNRQESISFLKDESLLPEWAGDIIVRIH